MRALKDTWTMAKRSLRHIVRSPDTIITVVLMPIALMLMFVYVFGGALAHQTGSISYVDFITPGIIVMTVITGISFAAFRLNTDIRKRNSQPISHYARRALLYSEWTGPVVNLVEFVLVTPSPGDSFRYWLPHECWTR